MKIQIKLNPHLLSSYSILIEDHLLDNIINYIPKSAKNIVIITDFKVKKYFGNALKAQLDQKFNCMLLAFAGGEEQKNIYTKIQLEEKMLKKCFGRDTLLIALGGGVVGDLAGFIAATYMRGISYIQIPTTLLAMVDSSVGGKTAINTSQGKNLIGAFWQPYSVLADINALDSLDHKQFINGLIEAFKMFLTSEKESLLDFNKNLHLLFSRNKEILKQLIYSAVQIKAKIVEADEQEVGQRYILNFGHTIGHAIEKLSNYKIMHGYAVGYGILVEAKISQLLGFLSAKNYTYIEKLMQTLSISIQDIQDLDLKKVIKLTRKDKKSSCGDVRYVLLKNLGQVHSVGEQYVFAVPDAVVKKAFKAVLDQNLGVGLEL